MTLKTALFVSAVLTAAPPALSLAAPGTPSSSSASDPSKNHTTSSSVTSPVSALREKFLSGATLSPAEANSIKEADMVQWIHDKESSQDMSREPRMLFLNSHVQANTLEQQWRSGMCATAYFAPSQSAQDEAVGAENLSWRMYGEVSSRLNHREAALSGKTVVAEAPTSASFNFQRVRLDVSWETMLSRVQGNPPMSAKDILVIENGACPFASTLGGGDTQGLNRSIRF